jgi:hypothetical protein
MFPIPAGVSHIPIIPAVYQELEYSRGSDGANSGGKSVVSRAGGSIRCARQRSEIPTKDQNDYPQGFLVSESTRYVGRAVVALAVNSMVKTKI